MNRIALPMLPLPTISPKGHAAHWATKYHTSRQATQESRTATKLALHFSPNMSAWDKATLQATFYCRDLPEINEASTTAIMDSYIAGIQSAGLIASGGEVAVLPPKIEIVGHAGRSGVKLVVMKSGDESCK